MHSYLEIIKGREKAKDFKFLGIGEFSREKVYIFGLSSLMYSEKFIKWINLAINNLISIVLIKIMCQIY